MSALVVLVATANHPTAPLPALDQEANEVLGLLRRWEEGADGRGRHVYVPAATAAQIFDQFRRNRDRVAVFHFSGHARADDLFVRGEGGQAAAGAMGLAAFLAEQRGL